MFEIKRLVKIKPYSLHFFSALPAMQRLLPAKLLFQTQKGCPLYKGVRFKCSAIKRY